LPTPARLMQRLPLTAIHITCLDGLWASYRTARMLYSILQRFVVIFSSIFLFRK
jgi:hypothetical protein